MRLDIFICQNMEAILVQSESIAASLLQAESGISAPLLRDQMQQILEAVAIDITAPQTEEQQTNNTKALISKLPGAPKTAAEAYGLLRAESGFEINQMLSEYRALRASVLKLWFVASDTFVLNVHDIVRFDKAIDQALCESLNFFIQKVEERKNLFLGMWWHDMHTPLQTIQMTAMLLHRTSAEKKVTEAAKRMVDCGPLLTSLLNELIQFNKIKLELGIRIAPTPQDMASLVGEELNQLRVAHPDKKLNLQVSGSTKGVWDGDSLKRVLGNLVVNAITYGNDFSPVTVRVAGSAEQMAFEVRNEGASLDTPTLQALFEPFRQSNTTRNYGGNRFGLGLFIAKQVAIAHNGCIDARCEDGDTIFSVQLPTVSLNSPINRHR